MPSSPERSTPLFLTPVDNMDPDPYVHMVLFFSTHHSDVSAIMQNLTLALAQTFTTIPFLAGSITHVPSASQRGPLAVTGPWRTAQDALLLKDLRKTHYPDYETLRAKHFPTVDVDYSLLLPTRRSMHVPQIKVLPLGTDERPIMLAQLNIIKGGTILGIVLDHAFTDGTGAIAVAQVWASYCRGEDGSQLISPDCLDRRQLMKGDESARLEEFEQYLYQPEPNISARSALSCGYLFRIYETLQLWIVNAMDTLRAILRVGPAHHASRSKQPDSLAAEIFFFSKAKLKELKQMASKEDETSWISTNDALASLIWCCVTAAHKIDIHKNLEPIKDKNNSVKREEKNLDSSLLGFPINARRYVEPPLPARFIGNVLIWGYIFEPLSTLVPTAEGVTECAHSLRRTLKKYEDPYLSRLIGALKCVPDISRVRPSAQRLTSGHVLIFNSWATQEWYDLDWGKLMGGKCERVRIHKTRLENFCLVLPELKSFEASEEAEAAGLEVIISIERNQMKSLRENELFNRFAEWRCS